MNDETLPSADDKAAFPVKIESRTPVQIACSVRTDFPNGSHLVEGPAGEKYLVSESGRISGNVPFIRRVQIDDLSKVQSHHIVHLQDTTSHTLHFAGGGVFSYLHRRDGSGMSIEANNILLRTFPDGVIVVCGTFREVTDANGGHASAQYYASPE